MNNYTNNVLKQLGLTEKQIEVLVLILPYPFGKGMRIKQTAQSLRLSESAVSIRLRNVRKNKKVWLPLAHLIMLAKQDKDRISNIGRTENIDKIDKIFEKF